MSSPPEDARFRDADEGPLRLRALDEGDLQVISALLQDAVTTVAEVSYLARHRRVAALVNRFRWERAAGAPERVRTVVSVENVTAVRAQGLDPRDRDTVLSILSLAWEAGEDGAGRLLVTLAGDGVIAVEVEALEVLVQDVTRPYLAPARRAPSHPD